MALSDVTFIRGEGGLGRPLAGKDHYSGILGYIADDDLPSGFSTSSRIKQVFSLEGAEALGIVNDWSDETKATGGQAVITGAASVGTVVSLTITQPSTLNALDETITLASYTVATGDAAADIASALVTAVNNRTSIHGYSASLDTATVELTAPDGFGAIPNGQTIAYSDSSNATITQFTGGAGSYLSALWYHINTYFQKQPKGVLWIGLYTSGAFDGTGISEMQQEANGEIRQLGIYLNGTAFATSQVTAIQAECDTLEENHTPMSVILASDVWGDSLSGLSDLSGLSSKNVSVATGQDGDNYGNFLANALGYSVSDLGALLGSVSFAKVNESIAWVQKFNLASDVISVSNDDINIVSGTEFNLAGFSTGDLYKDQAVSLAETVDSYHYIFQRTHVGEVGSFFQSSWTSISATSDYATIENNRTIDKAVRNGRTFLLPKLNSPIFINSDGTLDEVTIKGFENEVKRALSQLEVAQEISAYSVSIDPTQNVLSDSQIEVSITIVPVGVTKFIDVNISYALNV